ncbi:unnamed protein product [Effrenium voratum]|uniref:Uncharacterized protein n=1 Tax=Effrenium voratum TaxID=2562239 RepID=A0AA36HK03_9DINO|nr:unnamed protein product [Effrenium voratum]
MDDEVNTTTSQVVTVASVRDQLTKEQRLIITFSALGTLVLCICCGCCMHRLQRLYHKTRQVLPELPELRRFSLLSAASSKNSSPEDASTAESTAKPEDLDRSLRETAEVKGNEAPPDLEALPSQVPAAAPAAGAPGASGAGGCGGARGAFGGGLAPGAGGRGGAEQCAAATTGV